MKTKKLLTVAASAAILFSIFLTSCEPIEIKIPKNGLVGYWRFNGDTYDYSGKGHDGTVYNATYASDKDGVSDNALSFDGHGYVTIPYSSDFDFSKVRQFSYGCWIYNYPGAEGQTFIGQDSPNCEYFAFNLEQLTTGELSSNIHAGTCWNTFYTGQKIYTNQWHHIFVTANDSNIMRVYKDGQLVQTDTITRPMWGNYGSDIMIGSWDGYNGNVYGKIDEVAIYNRALSATEVKSIYSLGVK